MTIEQAKAEARALRLALKAQGQPISHGEALERVAHKRGARDWNTLHARLAATPPELALGDRVRGLYLGQAFTGRVTALSGPASRRSIEIRFDHPVDVVRFASFSNLRRQVRAEIDESLRSLDRTSDGQPQLIVERLDGA